MPRKPKAQQQLHFTTLSYLARHAIDIHAEILEHNAMLLDIRFSPNSRLPQYTRKQLLEALTQDHYYHLKEFGNINYRATDKPIELLNEAKALQIIKAMIDDNITDYYLLCACRDYNTCHRKTCATILQREYPSAIIRELPYPNLTLAKPKQQKLFDC